MRRPLFYILVVGASCVFWLLELLGNYGDYIEGSPIFLSKPFAKLFEINRLPLIATELLIPAGMVCVFLVLLILKFQARSIRYNVILMLFLATSFWFARTFYFPDRLVRYYQMSDPIFYSQIPEGDPFAWYLGVHLAMLIAVLLIDEYSKDWEEEEWENQKDVKIKNK